MDRMVMMETIMEAMNEIQLDVDAFMNQFDLSAENIQLATGIYVYNCMNRLLGAEVPEDVKGILQGLALSSFSTGFMLADKLAKEKYNA